MSPIILHCGPALRRSSGTIHRGVVVACAVVWLAAACGGTRPARAPLPSAPHPDIAGPAVTAIRRAGALRVASDLSYAPLAFRENGLPAGFEVELAGLLAQALGVRVDVLDTPRALMRPGFHGADLLLSEWTVESAPGLASRPYYVMRQALLWRDGQRVAGDHPLRGLRVAAQAQSPAEGLAARLGAAPSFLSYRPDEALRAVSRGAADAAIADLPLVSDYARANRGVHRGPGSGDGMPLVVVIRADAPDLAAFVSAAIRDLEQTNGLEQLRRRWQL